MNITTDHDKGQGTREIDMVQSHYAFADCDQNGRKVRAACGRWIEGREHANEPSCPGCRRAVEHYEALEF